MVRKQWWLSANQAHVKNILARLPLIIGLLFLYVPIVLLVLYSFNASRLVTVWAGFSLQWYSRLLANEGLLSAVSLSFILAATVASIATVLGTLAAYALNRFPKFNGRSAFAALWFTPMLLPEIVTGLALLLSFVSLSMDRGFVTVTLAHVTFTMAYVSVVVQSRLKRLDPSLEEAGLDLGCSHWQVFIRISLPLLKPALISSWLLSFSLSLDDLVIASFTTGPGATTLPMKIYSAVRLGVTPEINALSTLLLGVVAIALLITHWFQTRASAIR